MEYLGQTNDSSFSGVTISWKAAPYGILFIFYIASISIGISVIIDLFYTSLYIPIFTFSSFLCNLAAVMFYLKTVDYKLKKYIEATTINVNNDNENNIDAIEFEKRKAYESWNRSAFILFEFVSLFFGFIVFGNVYNDIYSPEIGVLINIYFLVLCNIYFFFAYCIYVILKRIPRLFASYYIWCHQNDVNNVNLNSSVDNKINHIP